MGRLALGLLLAATAVASGNPAKWVPGRPPHLPSAVRSSFSPTRAEERVALDHERLRIVVGQHDYSVEVRYALRNMGRSTIPLALGFPGGGHRLSDGSEQPALDVFEVTVGGERPWARSEWVAGGRWHVWSLRLPPAPTEMRVAYKVAARGVVEGGRVDYVLTTGALWRGAIGRLDIEVVPGPGVDLGRAQRVSPPGACRRSDGAILWRLVDYRPREDLRLCFHDCDARRRGATRAEPASGLPGCLE